MMRPMLYRSGYFKSVNHQRHASFVCGLLGAEAPAVLMSLSSPIRFIHDPSQRLLALAFLTPEASHFPLDEDTPSDSRAFSCND